MAFTPLGLRVGQRMAVERGVGGHRWSLNLWAREYMPKYRRCLVVWDGAVGVKRKGLGRGPLYLCFRLCKF